MDKVTIKDVAKAAGVSVATVSYVLSGRTDQKISDATTLKIKQIANLLNYSPNVAAQSLSTKKFKNIGMQFSFSSATPSKNYETAQLLNLIARRLQRMNYMTTLLPVRKDDEEIRLVGGLDGIIAIDLPMADFIKMGEQCFVPIISVDMLVSNDLFFQVYPNMMKAVKSAKEIVGEDYLFLTENYNNAGFLSYMRDAAGAERFKVIDPTKEITGLSAHRKYIVYGEYTALALLSVVKKENIAVITSNWEHPVFPYLDNIVPTDLSKKANMTVNVLFNAIKRTIPVTHDICI